MVKKGRERRPMADPAGHVDCGEFIDLLSPGNMLRNKLKFCRSVAIVDLSFSWNSAASGCWIPDWEASKFRRPDLSFGDGLNSASARQQAA
jgi:hypothetical protein